MLGIDLGGTAIKWVVLDDALRIAERGRLPTPGTREAIVAVLAHIIASAPTRGRVGIGVPGHVDRATGVTRFLPNVPGDWAGFPLGAKLSAAVLNDARAFCLAELTLGAARGETDALFLTLGTGVGGAVVSGGRLLSGPDDRLGEIGHMTYDRSGPRCGCGARGCLETFASAPAVARLAGGGRTPAQVVADAVGGEATAVAAMAVAGRAIGETVASLAAVLPARALVIGGGMAAALPVLTPYIRSALSERDSFIGAVDVRAAGLGNDAGAVGAALAANNPDEGRLR